MSTAKRARIDSAEHSEHSGPPGYDHYVKIADYIKTKTRIKPRVLIICGSGLGGLADAVDVEMVLDYHDIPGFPVSTVVGHKGRLVFGWLGDKPVVCMQGRFHMYEGYPLWKATMPVRVCRLLGATELIATNASGGMNPEYSVCDVMIMTDHINMPGMAGNSPLLGHNIKEFGPRFPPMSQAYDRGLQRLAFDTAQELGYGEFTRRGVYAMVAGPSYETVSEIKLLRMLGADVVGMSTAPEVIVGVHCGFKCLGMSLVTNIVITDLENKEAANHEEVIEAAAQRAGDMEKLMKRVIRKLE